MSVEIYLLPCSMQRGDIIQEVIGKMSAKILEREKKLDVSLPNIEAVVAELIDGFQA